MKYFLMMMLMFCFLPILVAQGPRTPTKPYVTVGKVFESEDVESRRYTGLVTPVASVHLVARVSGELLKIGFKEGDFVKRGQMLYQLDDIRYNAAVKNLEAKIVQIKAKLAYAKSNHARTNNLYEKQVVSRESIEGTQSTVEVHEAELLAAEADLITTKDDLAHTRIIAPIDGKISITNYTVGNYITPSSGTLATIIQNDPIRVRFSMSNRDFLSMFQDEEKLKENAIVKIRLADNSLFENNGKVEFINNEANRTTDTIQIYAGFENPKKKLIPGSTVTILLSRKKGKKMPAIVPSAIMHDTNSAYVYILNAQKKIERRDVSLGSENGQVQLITKGLSPGELVVIDGMHKTIPGAEVEPDFQGGR